MKNNENKNIWLIGYRCTGKSSVGKLLARALKKDFIDADPLLESEAGMPISQIVEKEGWPGFRKREKELVERLSRKQGQVYAPGGGVILDPDNVRAMKSTGLVVWLSARPKTIAQRMAEDEKTKGQRPSLTGQDVIDEINQVMEEREPLYRGAADFVIDADALSVDQVCERIKQALGL